MYKSFLQKLLQADPKANGISIDDYTNDYSNASNQIKAFTKKIIPIIMNCTFSNNEDNTAFFKDLINDLISTKYLLHHNEDFIKLLKKINMEKFFEEFLLESSKTLFTDFPFDNYFYLQEKEEKVFIAILLFYHVPKSIILEYAAVNYYYFADTKQSFIKYNEDIYIHFITDCSVSEDQPLIHNLSNGNFITFEYNNKIINEPADSLALNGDTIIKTFQKYFPNYLGIIRIWNNLEKYFLNPISVESLSFQDIFFLEDSDTSNLFYEINYSLIEEN